MFPKSQNFQSYLKGVGMKKVFALVVGLAMVTMVSADLIVLETVNDWGNSDGISNQWSYTCDLGVYEAFFSFDLSSVPDATITSAALTVNTRTSRPTERTIWDGAQLVGSFYQTNTSNQWTTIDLDVDALDLTGSSVVLKMTGPANGDHVCGWVDLMESGNIPTLTLNTESVPEPAMISLLGIGFLSLVGIRRRKKS